MAKGFDFVTHKRNSKGIVISKNPYRLFVRGSKWLFERPVKSGNMYSAAGELMEGPLLEEQKAEADKAKKEREVLEKLVAAPAPKLEPPVVLSKGKPTLAVVPEKKGKEESK